MFTSVEYDVKFLFDSTTLPLLHYLHCLVTSQCEQVPDHSSAKNYHSTQGLDSKREESTRQPKSVTGKSKLLIAYCQLRNIPRLVWIVDLD
jgi:hypothetical protein